MRSTEMKAAILFVTAALCSAGASAQDQERPRVFVAGRGTQNVVTNAASSGNHWFRSGHAETNVDAHDESMEVSKDLQQCQGVIVTVNEAAADYTVMLDRESKQKRGLLRSNSQVEVVNRAGDVIGAGAARTVNHASKDACNTILADWAKNGRISVPQAPTAPSASTPTAPAAAFSAAANPVSAAQPVTPIPPAQSSAANANPQVAGITATPDSESLGEVARRARQHAACLKLAADNPSIVCK
jgi:hypothetical protein